MAEATAWVTRSCADLGFAVTSPGERTQRWRSAVPVADHWPLWEELLQRYAVAQLALAAHRAQLLATGAPERSPATLPSQAADLVAELALLGADHGMPSTLGSIAHRSGLEVEDPRVQRVRDASFEPFATHAPRSELVALVDVARRVGAVTRALSWRAALIESPMLVHREHDFPVRGWLLDLLAA